MQLRFVSNIFCDTLIITRIASGIIYMKMFEHLQEIILHSQQLTFRQREWSLKMEMLALQNETFICQVQTLLNKIIPLYICERKNE